jgi:thioredoxin 1
MRVLTTTAGDRDVIAKRWTDGAPQVVVLLCAAWCDTCAEVRVAFERIAAANADMMFIWLDIEDDSDICGDVEVENFPTLAIFRGDRLLHFGVSLPQEGNVARLVAQCARQGAPTVTSPVAVTQMAAKLRQRDGR